MQHTSQSPSRSEQAQAAAMVALTGMIALLALFAAAGGLSPLPAVRAFTSAHPAPFAVETPRVVLAAAEPSDSRASAPVVSGVAGGVASASSPSRAARVSATAARVVGSATRRVAAVTPRTLPAPVAAATPPAPAPVRTVTEQPAPVTPPAPPVIAPSGDGGVPLPPAVGTPTDPGKHVSKHAKPKPGKPKKHVPPKHKVSASSGGGTHKAAVGGKPHAKRTHAPQAHHSGHGTTRHPAKRAHHAKH